MSHDKSAPPPPLPSSDAELARQGSIRDVRASFAKKGGQAAEESERTRAFIEGKIEMLRGDPRLGEAEKAKAIAELRSRL